MRPPRKALVLAAGFGTRMRPLTDRQPKPLLPFAGRPVLARTLDLLRHWGVREVLVNAHHLAGELVDWLRAHPVPGLAVSISFEPEILGTGGPLARAAWFLDDQPFWICNGDVAGRLDPAPLLRAFARRRPLAALWMLPDRGPRTVRVERGLVTDFSAPDPGSPGTATFSGLHLVTREVLGYLPGEGFSSIIDAYRRGLAAGRPVLGVTCPGSWWADLGTPEQVLQAHAEWEGDAISPCSRTGATRGRRRGFVALGRGVRVAASARLENVVVDDGAEIRPGAVLRNVVVGPGTVVEGRPTRLVVAAATALAPAECDCLTRSGYEVDRELSAECLDPRGSDRSFLRLRRRGWSAIAVRSGDQRKENEAFVPLARFLAGQGLRVPAILADDPARRFFVMEDLGTRDLLSSARAADEATRLSLYTPVMRLAADLHTRVTRAAARRARLPLQPAFGPDLWRWERELFQTHFLGTHGVRLAGLSPSGQADVLAELARASARLQEAPPVLVHRDFQSTNVLLTPEGPAMIDFQGMRRGPAAYDLASLLADPYVSLAGPTRAALAEMYILRTGNHRLREELPYAILQRLAQALGAFGRLGARPETRRFLAHIPPALALLREVVETLPGFPRLAQFLDRATRPPG